jgi:hypothetical protein
MTKEKTKRRLPPKNALLFGRSLTAAKDLIIIIITNTNTLFKHTHTTQTKQTGWKQRVRLGALGRGESD